MKPVLYVGLKGFMGHMPWGKLDERNLILVTSEKGSLHRKQVYGRAVDGIATHARGSDIVAKFPDLETARKAFERAAISHDAYCSILERMRGEVQTTEAQQRTAVRQAIAAFEVKG